MSSSHLSARVTGTEDYLVEAQFEVEQLIASSCDCPYAAENNFCKHMAAVMYAYENQYDSSLNSQVHKSVEDYVLNADENTVRLFLTEILRKDSNLFKQFVVSLGEPITKVDMDHYSNELRNIFSDYLYPVDMLIFYVRNMNKLMWMKMFETLMHGQLLWAGDRLRLSQKSSFNQVSFNLKIPMSKDLCLLMGIF